MTIAETDFKTSDGLVTIVKSRFLNLIVCAPSEMPWEIRDWNNVVGDGVKVPEDICNSQNDLIATSYINDANAILIAAAPELYEALAELKEQVGRTGWNRQDPIPSRCQARSDLLNRCEAALAKARGEHV